MSGECWKKGGGECLLSVIANRGRAHALFRISAHILLLSLFASPPVLAQLDEDQRNGTRGDVFVRALHLDNATAVANNTPQVHETQSQLGLNITSQYRQELAGLALSYRFTDNRYFDDSQEDDQYWEGDAEARLGNSQYPAEIGVFHSVRRVLNSPALSPILLGNSQDRTITGISPQARVRFGDATTLGVAYTLTDVNFGRNGSNDSERQGARLSLSREVSPIRHLELSVQRQDIDFDIGDEADYETLDVELLMRAEHRQYRYLLRIGATEVTLAEGATLPDDTHYTGRAEIVWQAGRGAFEAFVDRVVTDSSFGSGNAAFFSRDISFDPSIAERDQITQTSAGLRWETGLLCARCRLNVNVGQVDVAYFTRDRNDSTQQIADSTLTYWLREHWEAGVLLQYSKTDFARDDALLDDSKSRVVRLETRYSWLRNLQTSAYYEIDRRQFGLRDVEVQSLSIGVRWIFP